MRGDLGSIPGLGRSPGEGKGYPLQYSGLENSMDCIVHGGRKKLDMTEWLSLAVFCLKIDCWPLELLNLGIGCLKGMEQVFCEYILYCVWYNWESLDSCEVTSVLTVVSLYSCCIWCALLKRTPRPWDWDGEDRGKEGSISSYFILLVIWLRSFYLKDYIVFCYLCYSLIPDLDVCN